MQRNLIVFVAAIAFAMVGFGTASALADTPPSITDSTNSTGSPQVGDTLTEVPATWTSITPVGTPTIAWFDCTPATTTCSQTPITTGNQGGTYTVASSDLSPQSTIEVQETATDGTTTETQTSVVTLPVGPPVNITPPSITGTAVAGQTLTETPGTWLGAQSVSTKWLMCLGAGCTPTTPIPGAITNILALTGNLVGSTISVEESASNNDPTTASNPPTVDSAPFGLIGPSPTTTSLASLPSAPITNQPTTLVATVASSTPLAPPEGTVSFQVAGQPISGCSAVALQTFNQSAQVTCQSVFSAANSPEALTAVFTPSAGAAVGPSTSPTYNMAVGTQPTTTTLDVSNPIVNAGTNATFTATVRPSLSGTFQPTGKVEFLDYGQQIPQCSATPLHFAQGVATAQCVVHYVGVADHSITAFYLGGGGFSGSGTTPQAVTVKQLPPKIRGTITAKMAWAFHFFPTYTQVISLLLHKAGLGTVVLLTCRGSFCPFTNHSITVKKVHVCVTTSGKTSCVLEVPPSVSVGTAFGKSKLHVGDVVTVELTRPFWIGKGYVFTIRAGKGPKYHIGCLAPGSTKIGVGCLIPVSKKKKQS